MAARQAGFHPYGQLPPVLGGRIDAAQPLRHNEGNAATGGIWRVRGPGGTAVLKVARPPDPGPDRAGRPGWPTSDEPTHWNYWRREVYAYTSGLAATCYADAGITAPALVAHVPRPDGAHQLWLADAQGVPGESLSVADLADFAYRLGTAQARWIGRVPRHPWLSRGWLAGYLAEGPARRVRAAGDWYWDHPAARAWPEAVRLNLRTLWTQRDSVLVAAGAGPRTLCHLDVWPTNLVGSGPGRTILLDWSFAGEGAAGEDPANLIVDSVADGLIDAALLPDIVSGVTDGYATGLRDGGWAGPVDAARRAIVVCGAAKYCWFGPGVLSRISRDGMFGHPQYGQDRSVADALRRLEPLVTLLAGWARTALS